MVQDPRRCVVPQKSLPRSTPRTKPTSFWSPKKPLGHTGPLIPNDFLNENGHFGWIFVAKYHLFRGNRRASLSPLGQSPGTETSHGFLIIFPDSSHHFAINCGPIPSHSAEVMKILKGSGFDAKRPDRLDVAMCKDLPIKLVTGYLWGW